MKTLIATLITFTLFAASANAGEVEVLWSGKNASPMRLIPMGRSAGRRRLTLPQTPSSERNHPSWPD